MDQLRGWLTIFNEELKELEPVQIILMALVILFVARYVKSFAQYIFKLDYDEVKLRMFRIALYIPQVQAKIDGEMKKLRAQCMKKFSDYRKGNALMSLPSDGTSEKNILEKV